VILLIDCGNTRLKWRLLYPDGRYRQGFSIVADAAPFKGLPVPGRRITRVAISMVGTTEAAATLQRALESFTPAPLRFYWAESCRFGLVNAYRDVQRMGADRWHAMVASWHNLDDSFAVVDAGSAVTVDYVSVQGQHLGGYILPGLQMMRRSLQADAARIIFEEHLAGDTTPGHNTSECVHHGLNWLSLGAVTQVHKDLDTLGLKNLIVTGGDAERWLSLGLEAEHRPALVFEGLALIDRAESGR